MTVPGIFDLLGGPTAVALAAQVPVNTASNWKHRESIPARYHAALIKAGAGALTADMLVQAHARADAHGADQHGVAA